MRVFFSIDLGPAFLSSLEDGCYKSSVVDQFGLFYVLFIEREKDQPWCFGITGVLKEEKDRTEVWKEFWKKKMCDKQRSN